MPKTKTQSALFTQTKLIFRERSTIFFLIITCDPSIYTIDHPDLTVCRVMENSIGLNRVKMCQTRALTPRFVNGAKAHGIGKISGVSTKIGKFDIVLMYDVSIAR